MTAAPKKRVQKLPPCTLPPTVRPSCAKPGEVTNRGVQAHLRAGEKPCDACREARNAYQRQYHHHKSSNPYIIRLKVREYREHLRKAWSDGFAAAKLGRQVSTNPYKSEKAP